MTTAKNSASQKKTEAVKDVTVTVSLNSNSFIFPAGMCLVQSVPFQHAKLFVFICKQDVDQRPVTCLCTAASNHHIMSEIMIVEAQTETEAVIVKAFLTSGPTFSSQKAPAILVVSSCQTVSLME